MGREQKIGQLQQGDLGLPGEGHHSYEDFTQRPFYRKVNRETISLIPGSSRSVLDIATGTGGIIDLLLEEGKTLPSDIIHGIDLDEGALEEARKKFAQRNYPLSMGGITFGKASAEHTGEISSAYELATFCNAIHLTDVPNSLVEAYRVLEPGGMFLANSAYVKDVAYPEGTGMFWGRLISGARRKLSKEYDPGKPLDVAKLTLEDYVVAANSARFENVRVKTLIGQMGIDDVRAICIYDGFDRGALPGVPEAPAREALLASVDDLFAKMEPGATIPRGWMVIAANKPK